MKFEGILRMYKLNTDTWISMLKKIINIKNTGLFKDASCTSPAFDQATLIYAENGRGKSTLASILRSCATL